MEKRKKINDDSIANEAAQKSILLESVIQMRMKLDTSHLTKLCNDDLGSWNEVWNAMKSPKDYPDFLGWSKQCEEIDPLIVLDCQHELPSKSLKPLF